jgi:hypothetical protein
MPVDNEPKHGGVAEPIVAIWLGMLTREEERLQTESFAILMEEMSQDYYSTARVHCKLPIWSWNYDLRLAGEGTLVQSFV